MKNRKTPKLKVRTRIKQVVHIKEIVTPLLELYILKYYNHEKK
tara:strand:+ start:45 stop:173 length:129 start_codon:yes stop_codon:yes gene_type:complete